MAVVLMCLHSCARMGQPDGGWYDDTPPRVVSASPADRGINARQKKVTIRFDEFIKVDDPTNKVVISPPQLKVPEIKTAGKNIVIELQDSLKANTTYTIDFADAISDNNENNPMGNYTYSFSTGSEIDTLEVSGTILDASNLEPVKGILVGLHSNLEDSAFTKIPLERVSRTNGSGRFVIKGIAPGNYRIFALQDMDGDYMFTQKSEMMAFSSDVHTPTCRPDIRQDTIWRDSLRIDSIIRIPYTHFYPDDIVLMAFTEPQTDRYLLKTDRTEADRIGIYFTYGHDSLPRLKGLNFNADSAFVVEPSEKNDTIIYWLRDTALVNKDTLAIELTYMMTDTLGNLVERTDTIECQPKLSYERRQKLKEEEYEKWLKEQKKRAKKNDEPIDSIMPPPVLEPKINIPSGMNPTQNITIEMPAPLAKLDTAAIHLYSKHDTLWYRSKFELLPVEGKLRNYVVRAEWRPDIEYSFEVDSAAFVDIYGKASEAIKRGVKIAGNDTYASLFINIEGIADSNLVVQLLNQDNPVREVKPVDGVAEFYYLRSGSYFVRAFVDSNGNGIWDTGCYADSLQPEAVYYLNRKLECKAKWDVTITWNLTATPRDRQKPMEIIKQKPDKERKLRNRNADRARDLGIEYKRKGQ